VTPGNVVFKLNTLPHPKFTRDGDDLHYKGEVSLLEALVGFKKHIKHLDGHIVTLQRSSITKPGIFPIPTSFCCLFLNLLKKKQIGSVMTIKGEGMPVHNAPSQKGDLHITFTVIFPEKLTEEQKQGFNKLLG